MPRSPMFWVLPFLVAAGSVTGCQGESNSSRFDPGSSEPDNTATLRPAVVVIDDTTGFSVVGRETDGTLVVAVAPGGAAPEAGQILLSDLAHGAVFAKVEAVDASGDPVRLTTSVPQLREVFEKARIRQALPVTFADATKRSEALVGALSTGRAGGETLAPYRISLSGLVIVGATVVDKDHNSATVQVGIKEGWIDVSTRARFDADVSFTKGLESLFLGVDATVGLHLVLEAKVEGKLAAYHFEDDSSFLKLEGRIPFSLGVFPGWVTVGFQPKLTLDLDLEGSMSVTGGVDATYSATLGAAYRNGAWSKVVDEDESAEAIDPALDGAIAFGMRAGPKCEFYIRPYDVVGASLYAFPYGKVLVGLPITGDSNAWWKVLWGVEAGVEFDVSLLDWDIASYVVRLVDWSKELAKSDFSGEPCTPQCGGRACGPDPVCGQSCGGCPAGDTCDLEGHCAEGSCTPSCNGSLCGDNGCGSSCGSCAAEESCEQGQCVSTVTGCATVAWMDIPGGTCQMGAGDVDYATPVHSVSVTAFRMSRSEVSVCQYAACTKAGACSTQHKDILGCAAGDDAPINCLDWNQARAYCAWVGGRLCSEAEWEYAARNGSAGDHYPWGDDPPSDSLACFGGWESPFDSCSLPAGNDVWGVCDLAGNVAEWVEDDWHGSYGSAPINGAPWFDNPRSSDRVVRGGSYKSSMSAGMPPFLRGAYRYHGAAIEYSNQWGGRCCSDP